MLRCADFVNRMLRAGLIWFSGSGKTALFQLLTSARDAPRSGGKAEASVGVARVPLLILRERWSWTAVGAHFSGKIAGLRAYLGSPRDASERAEA